MLSRTVLVLVLLTWNKGTGENQYLWHIFDALKV